MFCTRRPLWTALACAVVAHAVASAADAPATYTLNLGPICKVGTKFSLVTDATVESQTHISMTMPGQTEPKKTEQNQQIIAHFEGEAEVLAVFPNGSIQKLAATVKTFTATSEGQPLAGLPTADAKIVIERVGAQKSCTVDGQPASANVARVIEEVIELGDEKYTYQDVFGPPGAVAVGATWPVNSAPLMTELKGNSDISMSSAKGTVKLDAISGEGADEVASVTGVFSVQGAKPTLPDGVMVDSMTISGGMAASVPATAKGIENKRLTSSMQMTAHGSGGGIEIKLDSAGAQVKTVEVTFH
jgi:hypothetical protein